MPAKVIRLRRAGMCAMCGLALPAHTDAWWDAAARTTTCLTCRPAAGAAPVEQSAHLDSPAARLVGQPGGSADREHEKRHRRHEKKIDEKWGPLAGVVKFISTDPQSTTAWAKGSEGERRLARHLVAAVGDRAVLLHDRKVPRTRANIDHIAIAASGVWVIDAKNYKGLVERRDVGGWFTTDNRLYVGGRDRTKAVDGLGWQVDAVRVALDGAEVPIAAALCFIESDWKFFARPFQLKGVWVTWAKKLAEMIAAPGPLTATDVSHVADRLATSLPPAVPTS